MNRPPHFGLRHLALNVKNLPLMERFYVDVLGFTVEWKPDDANCYLTSGIDNLAIHQVEPAEGFDQPKAQRLDHFGIIAGSADDVDRWYAFLQEHNVKFRMAPKTHRDGARSFYFDDPEGNVIQIIHHPPISGIRF